MWRRLSKPAQAWKLGVNCIPGQGASRSASVFVGLSGGVDSAVSAALLKEQGHDVTGVFMRNWDAADEAGTAVCPVDEDYESAQQVAESLGIPLRMVDFCDEYWVSVFEPFLDQYKHGKTPNPDNDCNRHVKFGAFAEYCFEHGADLVATGHYAGLEPGTKDDVRLTRAPDPVKDQTYFLCTVPAARLQRVLLPLGRMCKAEVRAEAERLGLPNADRKDSYGICFVGKRRLSDFLPQYIDLTPGRFLLAADVVGPDGALVEARLPRGKRLPLAAGAVLGEHDGAQLFTVGQNARISGMQQKFFVASKEVGEGQPPRMAGAAADAAADGDVLVVGEWDHPLLRVNTICTNQDSFNWLDVAFHERLLAGERVPVHLKMRHSQTALPVATASLAGGRLEVRLQVGDSLRAVAIGQTLALYDDQAERCVGGGPISAAIFEP